MKDQRGELRKICAELLALDESIKWRDHQVDDHLEKLERIARNPETFSEEDFNKAEKAMMTLLGRGGVEEKNIEILSKKIDNYLKEYKKDVDKKN